LFYAGACHLHYADRCLLSALSRYKQLGGKRADVRTWTGGSCHLLRRREDFGSVGWGFGPWRYWLVGILLPTLAIFIAVTVSLRLGYVAPAPASTPAGSLIVHPAKLLKNMLIYLVISLPLAFGEEFGWRGYAQPRLIRQFGLIAGLLALGIVWGLWHTPIYYVMHVYPDHPFFGPFVMTPIDNILVVVPMAWLYIRSRSIWVPTFTHAFADILWGFSGLMFPQPTKSTTGQFCRSFRLSFQQSC